MMRLVFLGFLFEVLDGRWIDGWAWSTGFCRDAGMLHQYESSWPWLI